MIRDVNIEDRPRERLLRQGAESLSNQELLAILLRTGTKEESVLVLANRVLNVFERLHHLKHATIEEMMAIKGIGEVKAIQLMAAVELGRRLAQKHNDEKFTIRSPQDAATYLMPDMTSLNQEHFVVLFLNIKNQIIHKQTIFIGSLNASIVHPREIVRPYGFIRNLFSHSSREISQASPYHQPTYLKGKPDRECSMLEKP